MSMPMPVGVSGPGALSQRTDVQPMSVPTGMPYGDASAMHQAEQSAPMAGTPGVPASAADSVAAAAGAPGGPPSPSPPATLDTPSQRPHEPVTAGAAAGPGPGPEVLNATPGAVQAGGRLSQAIFQAAAADPSGLLSQLGALAQQRGL